MPPGRRRPFRRGPPASTSPLPRSWRCPCAAYARGDEHPSTGLHDSLWARIVVLDDGDLRIAVVSVDLIGFNVDADPGPSRLAQQLRARGIDGWLVVSTHTHGGPRTLDLGVPYAADRQWGGHVPYTTWVEDRIIDGVTTAAAELQPVQVRAGEGAVDLSFNRRLVHPDGTVEMIWGRFDAFTADQLGPTDPAVGVVRLDDATGQPVAVLVNYACHAVVLGSGNHRLTADFPGYATAYLERQLPGAVALFLQGAAGDLDPRVDVQNGFAPAQTQGQILGREALRVVRDLALAPPLEEDPRLQWVQWQRPFRLNSDPAQQVDVGFGLLRLGRHLAFGTLPGEPFVGLQLDLKARSPVAHTYLLGYTNGYVGYLPTLAAHREGGYGADYGDTFQIQPEAGEAMVEAIVADLVRGAVPATAVAPSAAGGGGASIDTLSLAPTIPNPFNGETVIPFALPTLENVELVILDLLGRQLRTLWTGPLAPGPHQLRWDGRDDAGRAVASGIYLCRLTAGGGVVTRRLAVVR
ncbi:MAG: neutral/alkaline non-lysosomal ceramidase N-terminal domain-containing protein [Gemmatimonadota bacterium]